MTTDTALSITVNGEDRSVPQGYQLTDVLQDLEIDPDYATGVAVAINREVIRRQDWGDVAVDDGDDVEVVQAQQGG